jgi:LacI family transcriptional regulator
VTVRRMDVARLAGTSPAVVSYVLNGGPRPVSARTRAKVLAAIEQLGYRPNSIARSLRMSRSMTLGLVVPDTANPFFAHMARAIEEAAFAAGYTLLIGNAAESEKRQTAYTLSFLSRQVDGLFLVPAHGSGLLDELRDTTVPWLALDRGFPEMDERAVRINNRDGAREATRHLLDHGRRGIACIAGPVDVLPARERVEGWRDAVTEAGLDPDRLAVYHGPFGRRAGYEAALAMLGHRDDVEAIFVASDEQAIGVLRALHELGKRCPEDVAVVSFDGIAEAEFSSPSLTTMAQPFPEFGEAAVAQLLALIEDPSLDRPSAVLSATLVVGESCGCVATATAGEVSR